MFNKLGPELKIAEGIAYKLLGKSNPE